MQHRTDESGITIVEIMISIVVLGVVLSAFVSVMIGGLQSMSDSRGRQDASQLSTEVIEELRAVTVSEVAMKVDPAATLADEVDIASVSTCTAQVDDDGDGTVDRTAPGYDPDDGGPIGCEELLTHPQGRVVQAVPFNGVDDQLTVLTVVTRATDADVAGNVRRVTIVMTYDLPEVTRTIRRESFFSEVSRG